VKQEGDGLQKQGYKISALAITFFEQFSLQNFATEPSIFSENFQNESPSLIYTLKDSVV